MRFDSDFTQTSGQKNGEWSLWLAVLDGVVYIAGGNRGTGRLCSVERLERFLPGAKRCLNLYIYRPGTEDIIHYFTLMSSELHYLDIILKIENLTLMSSASGKFDINVLSIWENHLSNTHIFVILPVLFLFSHVLNASEQLQLLIYALLSLKCRELYLRVF